MKLATTLAASLVAALLLSTSASFARGMNAPIIDVTPPDYTPINIADPFDGINDAVLDGAEDADDKIADGALIVQSLRQNAGATVAMQSSPGAGTRVEIFFARAAAAP
ncbi:MAG: hypothetical protein ABIY37_00920 [Devosia sp.]